MTKDDHFSVPGDEGETNVDDSEVEPLATTGQTGMGQDAARRAQKLPPQETVETVNGFPAVTETLMQVTPDASRYPARECQSVLLSGPGGKDKQLLAKAVAGTLHYEGFAYYRVMQGIQAGYSLEDCLDGIVQRVREEHEQVCIHIENLNRLRESRGREINGEAGRLSRFLDELAECRSQVIVVASIVTEPRETPSAQLTAQFDDHICVEKPDQTQRQALLRQVFKDVKVEYDLRVDVDAKQISKMTDGWCMQTIEMYVHQAALTVAQREREAPVADVLRTVDVAREIRTVNVDLLESVTAVA